MQLPGSDNCSGLKPALRHAGQLCPCINLCFEALNRAQFVEAVGAATDQDLPLEARGSCLRPPVGHPRQRLPGAVLRVEAAGRAEGLAAVAAAADVHAATHCSGRGGPQLLRQLWRRLPDSKGSVHRLARSGVDLGLPQVRGEALGGWHGLAAQGATDDVQPAEELLLRTWPRLPRRLLAAALRAPTQSPAPAGWWRHRGRGAGRAARASS
mmetsp:Transcript_88428/g.245523  ORF Transcript_88428/g.245523 Transcript_88428/m.245523 type:complete len:211 (+) Transcript_88428:767-1399(+)